MAKIAVITGAGTGIGKASALALMRTGWSVVLSGRRKEMLEAVAREGEATGQKSLVVPGDVGDPASVRNLFARTWETFGRLDLLFNNAGIGAPAVPMEDLPLEKWKAVVDTNLTGSFLCTQEAIRIMKDQTPRGRSSTPRSGSRRPLVARCRSAVRRSAPPGRRAPRC